MKRPLKILFFLEDLCFGGTQKQNLELASRLDRSLFSPAILTITGRTDLDELAEKASVPVTYAGTALRPDPLFFARLPGILKSLAPDILVCCTALPNIWGRIWGKFLKIPVIVGTCRGGGAPTRQHERFLWRLSDHIVCNSLASVQAMTQKGVPKEHLTYIPNGVDTYFFHPAANKNFKQLIVCVARLAEDKDHRTLIRAFGIVAKNFPQATLRLVGTGPEEIRLKKFAADFLPPQAQERLEFAGACANPAPHYKDASIFVLSSIREGQPNVILEAMSSGLPICATNVGGIPALVRENINGLLCQPGSCEDLATNLEKLLANPAMAQDFGSASRHMVENNFSFAAMVRAHQDLFITLADNIKTV